MDTIRETLKPDDDKGYPTGEEAFNYAPKSYLVTGNLAEFIGEHGVNKDKLRSFELLRRNLHSPEIITFDELYERAKFIVDQNNEALATLQGNRFRLTAWSAGSAFRGSLD